MTQQAIRGALQVQLLTLGWADQTALEDDQFTPTDDVPYQEVDTIFAEPNTYGINGQAQERGFFQVTLQYPTNTGVGVSGARAEAIRTAFAPVQMFPTAGGGFVKISRRAEVKRLGVDGDRDVTVIRIRFADR